MNQTGADRRVAIAAARVRRLGVIRVVCGRCRRKLGQLASRPTSGEQYRCDRCGAAYSLRPSTLESAYERAVEGERTVITLPQDAAGVPSGPQRDAPSRRPAW